MKRTVALVACGATLVTGGIFAGSVIGGDGSVEPPTGSAATTAVPSSRTWS